MLRFFFFKQKTAYDMLRSLVGSEMCIRDRYNVNIGLGYDIIKDQPFKKNIFLMFGVQMTL